MPDPVNLELIAAQLRLVLAEQRAMRSDMRRTAETLAGLSRAIDHIRDDLSATVKAELGGLFAMLETRLEHRIASEISERLAETER